MPILSTKRLREELNKVFGGWTESLALSTPERVKFNTLQAEIEVTRGQRQEALARNETLVQANRELVRTVNALEQVLHGTAQEEVQRALNAVVDKLRG